MVAFKLIFGVIGILAISDGTPQKTSENSTIAFSLYASDLSGCGFIFGCDTSVTIRCQSVYSDWRICGETKRIRNNNNPVWPEVFVFELQMGTRQRWRLDLKEYRLIGTKPIANFMVLVDDYAQGEGDLRNDTLSDNRGTLWIKRLSSAGNY